MFFWNCEASSPFDYALLVIAATCWGYAGFCLLHLRYERRSPLVWWEPVPLGISDLTPRGRTYHQRFVFAALAGVCAMLLAVALCSSR